MLTKYDIAYTLSAPIAIPYFAVRYLRKRKSREPLAGMFGRNLAELENKRNSLGSKPVAWFHAVSMGEVNVARAVILEFRRQLPDYAIIVSTRTETGQQNALKHLSEIADIIFYHPIDLSPVVEKFLNVLKPSVYVLLETELWPNILLGASRSGAKIFLVNGKISKQSYKTYRHTRWFWRNDPRSIHAFLMQTEDDARRTASLLGNEEHIYVTGNCKFDIEPKLLSNEEKNFLLEQCHLPPDLPVLVVGSTHPGEERLLLDVYVQLKKEIPRLVMIIAPRHPERFDSVYALLIESHLNVLRISAPHDINPDIVLLDKMGMLAQIYGLGNVAVLGGSFVDVGGHNLLEAAIHSIPVVYGPFMYAQKEMTDIMNTSGGGIQTTSHELKEILLKLFNDDEYRKKSGNAAYRAATKNRGCTSKTIEILRAYINGQKISNKD